MNNDDKGFSKKTNLYTIVRFNQTTAYTFNMNLQPKE